MSVRGFGAQNPTEQVRAHDQDMELIRCNRAKLGGLAFQVLLFARSQLLRTIDIVLGLAVSRTGFWTDFSGVAYD
jgi:hypothetical protein